MNEIRKIVSETYRRTISDGAWPEEFKRALKAHERIPVFFDNLVKQLSKPGLNPTRETIELATRDLTRVFAAAVHRKAEERIMSPVRQAMLKAQQSRIAEMKKLGDALDLQGEANEKVTQDKRGNEISSAQVKIDKI
jgi:hypothetical protein